ncbi:hypothetical protein FB45DRAFT_913543 [Roridomyces roridus]|uniref:Uncharacterized protein n=1 Tax=Roridomyces roridus TaxID=1738132 RepID=A0AAD7BX90_9AGAR|nr:hypothetical protein FB45DRAFT_913543 [Roridomyces roridus]
MSAAVQDSTTSVVPFTSASDSPDVPELAAASETPHHQNGERIALAVVSTICIISLLVGLALVYRWRKRRIARRGVVSYAPIPLESSQALLPMQQGSIRSLPTLTMRHSNSSVVSVPSFIYDPGPQSAVSPAVESSDLFHGGYSPVAPLSNFARLVPMRRPDGRL